MPDRLPSGCGVGPRRSACAQLEIWQFLQARAPLRYFFSTLARRIVLANLLGLAVLVSGMVWLSQTQAWLITAKYESLKVQGEIIASAIASSALVEREGSLAFNPERLPELDGLRVPFRDDGFAAMELSLRHERVIPVLKRLIHPTHNTRARIYDRNGKLIVNSNELNDLAFPLAPGPGRRPATGRGRGPGGARQARQSEEFLDPARRLLRPLRPADLSRDRTRRERHQLPRSPPGACAARPCRRCCS